MGRSADHAMAQSKTCSPQHRRNRDRHRQVKRQTKPEHERNNRPRPDEPYIERIEKNPKRGCGPQNVLTRIENKTHAVRDIARVAQANEGILKGRGTIVIQGNWPRHSSNQQGGHPKPVG